MRHRVRQCGAGVVAIRAAAVILKPCGMGAVLVQILGRNAVVLAGNHAAQAGKEALNLIGVGAVL
jgi:hypothetical protein